MANHKSSEKRIRSSEAKKDRNKYQHKTTRGVLKKLKLETDKAKAQEMLPKVVSMVDKLAKTTNELARFLRHAACAR